MKHFLLKMDIVVYPQIVPLKTRMYILLDTGILQCSQ
jgi:hypothetical protein